MTEFHIIPDKWNVFSGSALKVIAVLSMFIDHVGCHLVDKKMVLLQLGSHKLLLYRLMRDLGRFAFPIFCFLLIEGFLHTRSKVRYGVSLAALAVISAISGGAGFVSPLITAVIA